MPRRLLKKIMPDRHALSQRWFMRPFAMALRNPVYWTVHRRGVLRAVALGLFICFIPLPIHLLLAPIAAILLRANVPVTVATLLLVNPLTYVPVYFAAYWVGVHITGTPPQPFDEFALTWDWVETRLVDIWKPFLVGCLVSGVVAAATGYWALALLWRIRVSHQYQQRPSRLRGRGSASDENSAL